MGWFNQMCVGASLDNHADMMIKTLGNLRLFEQVCTSSTWLKTPHSYIHSVVPNKKIIFPEFERILRCFSGHDPASLSQPREWNINEFSGRLKAYPAFLKDKKYTTNALFVANWYNFCGKFVASGRLKAYPAFLKDKKYTTNARKHTIFFTINSLAKLMR